MAKAVTSARSKGRAKGNVRRVADVDAAGLWHRPALMNLVADVLFLCAGVLLVIAGAGAMKRLPILPLRELVVTSNLNHVTRSQVEQAATTVLNGNFLTVDLDAAKAGFERLPWVRHVAVRRHWPDKVELHIEEHEVVGRWSAVDGESRLLNRQGEIFVAESDAALPEFIGADTAAVGMLSRFHALGAQLAPAGRQIALLEQSSRGAWRTRLDDGLELDLGRDRQNDPIERRLARFVALRPAIEAHLAVAPKAIDLRYPNGLAVRSGATPKTPGSVS